LLTVDHESSRAKAGPLSTKRTGSPVIRSVPKHERSDGKSYKQRIQQVANLRVLPYERALQVRERNHFMFDVAD
jgi:hypothetical protein